MDDVLTVIASIRSRPGQRDALRAELEALVGPTTAEEGCIDYRLHADPDDEDAFVFYENWRDRPSWEAHMQSPHMQESRDRRHALTDGDVRLQLLKPIA